MKILVTSFEPFGGETMNPACEAVKMLPDVVAGAEICKLNIPVTFSQCAPAVEACIRANSPDAVLCVGQAGGRSCVSVERVGINLVDARIPDNEGVQPVDEPVQPEGPAAYFATVPVKAMVRHIREGGIPCQASCTAGTYVCNYILYQVLHMTAEKFPGVRGGFIHVPYADEQAVNKPNGTPSTSLATIARALELAVEAIVQNLQDVHESMGSVC